MRGTVKTFNAIKGYGFITAADGRDAFFHYSEILVKGFKYIDEGQEVEFELVEGERGLQARKVKKIVESDV